MTPIERVRLALAMVDAGYKWEADIDDVTVLLEAYDSREKRIQELEDAQIARDEAGFLGTVADCIKHLSEELAETIKQRDALHERLAMADATLVLERGVGIDTHETLLSVSKKAHAEAFAAKARAKELEDAALGVMASLAAALYILRRTPQAKRAAASDKMFFQMMQDYENSLEKARDVLTGE